MHESPIPGFTLHASNERNPAPSIRVRRSSPQMEYEAWTTDSGDPEAEPMGWGPLTGVAAKISAGLDLLEDTGRSIYDQVLGEAKDVVGTLNAVLTGEAPEEPGPLFQILTGAASRVASVHKGYQDFATRAEREDNVAGYIELPDGRKIPVPKAPDPRTQAEDARSDATKALLRAKDMDVAIQRSRERIEASKQEASRNQFNRLFALREKDEARKQGIFEIQERAAKLALDRQTVQQRGPGWWALPSRIEDEPPKHRTVRAIGPGVPGGIQERLY